MWKGLTLEREICWDFSASLSLTLSKNEKVKHHINVKTHYLIVLRFWVENDVNFLCVGFMSCLSVNLFPNNNSEFFSFFLNRRLLLHILDLLSMPLTLK